VQDRKNLAEHIAEMFVAYLRDLLLRAVETGDPQFGYSPEELLGQTIDPEMSGPEIKVG